jgi:hypothetical protein
MEFDNIMDVQYNGTEQVPLVDFDQRSNEPSSSLKGKECLTSRVTIKNLKEILKSKVNNKRIISNHFCY